MTGTWIAALILLGCSAVAGRLAVSLVRGPAANAGTGLITATGLAVLVAIGGIAVQLSLTTVASDSAGPLGPERVAAALAGLPGIGTDTASDGLLLAVVVITAMTAWTAFARLGRWQRPLATVTAAIPYLVADAFSRGSLTEPVAALFLLALTATLARAADDREGGRPGWQIPALLTAGIGLTLGLSGLAWPAVIALGSLAWLGARPGWRTAPAGVLLAAAPVAALLAAGKTFSPEGFLATGPEGFLATGPDGVWQGAFSPLAGLGVWFDPDPLTGLAAPLAGPAGAVGVLALLFAAWWWLREPRSVWPVAFLVFAAGYLATFSWADPAVVARATAIGAPVIAVTILLPLLSGPRAGWKPQQGMEFGGWVSLAALFVTGSLVATVIALAQVS